MSLLINQKLYTAEEFLNLEWPDDDDNDYELIKGEIVPKQGYTSGRHGYIVSKIATKLNIYAGSEAGDKRTGKVYSEASCILGPVVGSTDTPKPDVCFVLEGRTPPDFDSPIPVTPDLVVEVWSPSDTTEKIQNKIDSYQADGVRLTWSVYMLSRFVAVYTLGDSDIKFFGLKDDLNGGDVLPGFYLPVKDLFE